MLVLFLWRQTNIILSPTFLPLWLIEQATIVPASLMWHLPFNSVWTSCVFCIFTFLISCSRVVLAGFWSFRRDTSMAIGRPQTTSQAGIVIVVRRIVVMFSVRNPWEEKYGNQGIILILILVLQGMIPRHKCFVLQFTVNWRSWTVKMLDHSELWKKGLDVLYCFYLFFIVTVLCSSKRSWFVVKMLRMGDFVQ